MLRRWQGGKFPQLRALDVCGFGPVRSWAAQREVSVNVMRLNHPETILPTPRPVEKLSSTKLVPGAKKLGDHCPDWSSSGNRPALEPACSGTVCSRAPGPACEGGEMLSLTLL